MQNVSELIAADIMVHPVECAEPHETLEHLEERFLEDQVSGMPVVENGQLVGFISKTDLVRVAVVQEAVSGYVQERWPSIGPGQEAEEGEAQELPPEAMRQFLVRDAMRSSVKTCSPRTPVPEVAATMVKKRIHHLVVMDQDEIAGIISTLDLAKLIAADA